MIATDTSPSVFIVDDDASVRDGIQTLLRSVGLRAEVFSSAEEFLRIERPASPSCLVLDVRLPGANGLDLQDRLESIGFGIPIIFITAHGDVPTSLRALKGGAVEFLAKPFKTETLLAAIHQALEADRRRRQEQVEFSALRSSMIALREREAVVDVALLNRMADRLSAADPLNQVLNEVVEFIAAVIECDSCMIYILENDELVLRASENPHPEVTGRLKMRVGEGITGWVAQHRETVVVSQRAHDDPRFKLFNELPEDHYESFLSVPLVSGGRLVGVINIQNRTPHQYTTHEVRVIATIGFLVGAEVERARLENENSELSDKLESRKLLERAKGILQQELNISEEDAYLTIQRESKKRRRSMREIAEAIVLNDELKRGSRS